jgi:cellulose synthase/poly-beta-1,6-N-acetylglucosamine synthase-like glycosyltransferase
MWSAVTDGLAYVTSQSPAGIIALFWFTILFDVPRYTFSFLVAAFCGPKPKGAVSNGSEIGKVSVILAGHNEADTIERCVRSFHEQSRPPDEIIVVSDGSTDGMPEKLKALQNAGVVDSVHCTQLRGGKSAAVNLGARWASGDVFIIADCDCTYDRHAVKRILAPLADRTVGAVAGNILVRNAEYGFITKFQAIEYLISISLGKQAAALTDHVTCASGAFGAFRRTALESVNFYDVGGGEDLDLTLKLRKAGWKVEFGADAICYTDTPPTFAALVRQRFRWERDAVRLRYRKHGDLMNPFSYNFEIKEFLHELEFLIFHIAGAAVLPIYIVWLFMTYGDLAPIILISVQAGLFILDLSSFLLAAYVTPHARALPLLPYIAGYSLFNGIVMRNVRLAAYLQEWIFNASASDEYLPAKVRLTRRW